MRDKIIQNKYNYYLKVKQKAFSILGDVCVRCGFSDVRALQLDHIAGDGYKTRSVVIDGIAKRRGVTVMNCIAVIKGSTEFQLLCANCNWIKRAENNETRWRDRK